MVEMNRNAQPIWHICEVYDLLLRFGIGKKYQGFQQCAHAVYLSAESPERLTLVTKWLYPDVGKFFGVSWMVVERNLRTVARVAWENNRSMLEFLAGEELPTVPAASTFVKILTHYFLNNGKRAA